MLSFASCPRLRVGSLVTLLTAVWGARAATAQDAGNAASARIISPSLGRPVFVEPGGSFTLAAEFPESAGLPTFELNSTRGIPLRVALEPVGGPDAQRSGGVWQLRVPRDTAPRTYDVAISAGSERAVARHCVAVGRVGQTVRMVHLSNLNLGDLCAPHLDERLIDELNLLAPTLIIGTGDYLDATHRDPERGWSELIDVLTRCDAPLLLAAGDHDAIELYSRHVAASPIGLVDVGPHRGLVLYDLPARPIESDAEQLRWVERLLARPLEGGVTFVVAHDETPNLLKYWQTRGDLPTRVRAARLGLWIAGGRRDWDGAENASLVRAAAPLLFVRTHQGSGAGGDGADGVSHYRVLDLDGERVRQPADAPAAGATPSLTAGRLHAWQDGRGDGSETRVLLKVVNNHAFRLDRLARRIGLRASGDTPPWCRGGAIAHATRIGDVWDCVVSFDLPDRGSAWIVAGTDSPPAEDAVAVQFDVPRQLAFSQHTDASGLTYQSVADADYVVHLHNRGPAPTTISPLVRLDGSQLAYRLVDVEGPLATSYAVCLAPGGQVALQLDLSAVRVRPGRRDLQVYLTSADGTWAPHCHELEVRVNP